MHTGKRMKFITNLDYSTRWCLQEYCENLHYHPYGESDTAEIRQGKMVIGRVEHHSFVSVSICTLPTREIFCLSGKNLSVLCVKDIRNDNKSDKLCGVNFSKIQCTK